MPLLYDTMGVLIHYTIWGGGVGCMVGVERVWSNNSFFYTKEGVCTPLPPPLPESTYLTPHLPYISNKKNSHNIPKK